jgi:uncharacterized phiE125 gp8 family phage protein
MALETLVAPATEPVSLAQARAFLRIGTDGDDSVLTSLIIAAREAVEARTGRALVTRTLRQRFMVPSDPKSTLPGTLLPGRVPATNLVAVRVIASDGSESVAPPNLVRLIDGRLSVTAGLSSSALGLSIDYQAGYGPAASNVPEAFKISILEAVADALIRRDNSGSGSNSDGGQSWDQAVHEVKL